jgi:hypothetical protein
LIPVAAALSCSLLYTTVSGKEHGKTGVLEHLKPKRSLRSVLAAFTFFALRRFMCPP